MAGSPQNNSNIPYNYRSGIFSAAIVAKFVVSSFLQAKQNEKKKDHIHQLLVVEI